MNKQTRSYHMNTLVCIRSSYITLPIKEEKNVCEVSDLPSTLS